MHAVVVGWLVGQHQAAVPDQQADSKAVSSVISSRTGVGMARVGTLRPQGRAGGRQRQLHGEADDLGKPPTPRPGIGRRPARAPPPRPTPGRGPRPATDLAEVLEVLGDLQQDRHGDGEAGDLGHRRAVQWIVKCKSTADSAARRKLRGFSGVV
jgi:hypothetical protein